MTTQPPPGFVRASLFDGEGGRLVAEAFVPRVDATLPGAVEWRGRTFVQRLGRPPHEYEEVEVYRVATGMRRHLMPGDYR